MLWQALPDGQGERSEARIRAFEFANPSCKLCSGWPQWVRIIRLDLLGNAWYNGTSYLSNRVPPVNRA